MNFERLRWGEWIAGIAGGVLVLVTFRAWYEVSGGGARVTAWDALTSGRYLLLAAAAVGILLLLLTAAEQTEQMSALPFGYVAALVGLGCTVYIAYRLATPPSDSLDASRGLYFGLAAAAGVAIGGLLAGRDAGAYEPVAQPPPEQWGATGSTDRGFQDPSGGAPWTPGEPTTAPGISSSAVPPPATAAGARGAASSDPSRPLEAGDEVALTAGSARFPAGTVVRVVQVFAGGALVEVTAPDGLAERFEVPEEAFERAGAGGAAASATAATPAPPPPATSGQDWSPGMPEPAAPATPREDWGFDEAAAAGAGAAAGAAVSEPEAPAEPEAGQAAEKKVPFWKREIGGGKKKKAAAAETETAEAPAATDDGALDGDAGEQKPGFFKRMFGGGGAKAEDESTEALDDGAAATAVAEAEPEPIPAPPEPEPEPVAAVEPEPEPEPPAPEPPAPEPEPEPPAPEPEAAAQEPEPEPPAPEPEPEPPAPEPEPEAAAPVAEAAAAEAASAPAEEEAPKAKPKPKAKPRRKSSATRKVPKEAVDATKANADAKAESKPDEQAESKPDAKAEPKADDGAPVVEVQPNVGDEVQLKVSGGPWEAGTRGTVVDVFSAGVIVEVTGDDGKSERLDLPFEAVGPADGA